MRTTIRNTRVTPAFLLALVALLFSMAGTGYAAAQLSGKQIKKRSLPADRVVKNSLTGVQINESKLTRVPRALLADTSKAADTAKSAATAQSAITAQSATTAESAKTSETATKALSSDSALDAERLGGRTPGEYMRSSRTVRQSAVVNVAINNGAETTASCAAGEVPVSGGGAWYIAGTNTTIGSATLSSSLPIVNGAGVMTGWRAEGKNTSGAVRDFRAFVVCAAG
jgi:hypothetical protein